MNQTSKSTKLIFVLILFLMVSVSWAQQNDASYKRRVLEASEVDLLFSYYSQDGQNAAVTGGEGAEELLTAIDVS